MSATDTKLRAAVRSEVLRRSELTGPGGYSGLGLSDEYVGGAMSAPLLQLLKALAPIASQLIALGLEEEREVLSSVAAAKAGKKPRGKGKHVEVKVEEYEEVEEPVKEHKARKPRMPLKGKAKEEFKERMRKGREQKARERGER